MLDIRECQDLTVYQVILKAREAYGDRVLFAQSPESGLAGISYEVFCSDVLRLAQYFARKGLTGKRIVISGRSVWETGLSTFGAWAMGAEVVLLNFDLPDEELFDALGRIDPELVIGDREDLGYIGDWIRERQIATLVTEGQEENSIQSILEMEQAEYEEAGTGASAGARLILLSSGSTGPMKLVELAGNGYFMGELSIGQAPIIVMPLYHMAGIHSLSYGFFIGAKICLSDMRNAFQDIAWFRPDSVMAVPMFFKLMKKRAEDGQLDLSSFRKMFSVGAPEDPSSSEYFQSKGIFTASLYGATELQNAVGTADPEDYKRGSVGKIGWWNEVCLSERGELLIRSKSLMKRYLGDPEATAQALADGWFHTGDAGYVDEDGFLYLTGRIKNIIILPNGENVSPEAIEKKLSACEAIETVIVRADGNFLAAEIWCGQEADPVVREKVQKFVDDYNRGVPSYYAVRKVIFRETPFEKTATGKIKR